jgi:hypothetical protein
LDLRKAYDTVWRDGLLYKLWHAGVRGRLWRYIAALYSTSSRAVRVGNEVSQLVSIDLGVAQGDTLSCILFDIFVNDLVAAYKAACPGVPLPAPPQEGGPLVQDTLASLLFAYDFVGLAESPAALQRGVDAARAWCNKWRMQANVGPAKTAVMVFAPDIALSQPIGDIQWGVAVLPVVTKYKYLGVMLSSDCSWSTQAAYIRDKATWAAYALGCVLHNRRMYVGVRRLVLLAVLRPVVEHGGSVWEPSPADMQRLEQVQVRVLRRVANLDCLVPDDVLRMEFGCRSYARWMAHSAQT